MGFTEHIENDDLRWYSEFAIAEAKAGDHPQIGRKSSTPCWFTARRRVISVRLQAQVELFQRRLLETRLE